MKQTILYINKQTKHTVKTDTCILQTNNSHTHTLSQTTPPRRSRGTLEIERYKSQVSLALEKAEERLRTSWHCRVLELFTGEGRMVGERVSSGFHESVSTLLGNQVRLFTAGYTLCMNQRVYKASAYSTAPSGTSLIRTPMGQKSVIVSEVSSF